MPVWFYKGLARARLRFLLQQGCDYLLQYMDGFGIDSGTSATNQCQQSDNLRSGTISENFIGGSARSSWKHLKFAHTQANGFPWGRSKLHTSVSFSFSVAYTRPFPPENDSTSKCDICEGREVANLTICREQEVASGAR